MIPYITEKTTEDAIESLRGYSYNKKIQLRDDIILTLIPAGHIAGACMVLIEIKDDYEVKRVLFSGDTSGKNREIPFTMKPDLKDMKINYIITESTYNDRLIPKNNGEEKLEKYIRETCIQNKRNIAIPVFSIQRSTSMLLMLRKVFEKNPEFNKINVIFASPMACKSHKEICNPISEEFYDKKWIEDMDIINWKKVKYIENFKEVVEALKEKSPTIYLSSSGMAQGGYITYILSQLLTKKNNRIIFCGFQCEGTVGYCLLNKIQKNITIADKDGNKKSYPVKAKINEIEGMSSHCDYEDLINLYSEVEKKKLKTILLTHGDFKGMQFFKEKIEKEFKNVDIKIPKYNEVIRLV